MQTKDNLIDKLHKHIDILNKQLAEKDDTIRKQRADLGLSTSQKWVEEDG
jgi:uncharacterized protein (DUF3084 family)|tara:strand:+ start:91 stop:240 length:150 start_codon:yes stop_codon:yes gene_type:complete